jgi:hypothetical protein
MQFFIITSVRTSDPETNNNVLDIGREIYIFIDVVYAFYSNKISGI